MIDNLSTVTAKLVAVALDGLAMQQRVIANNIANVNTSGFSSQQLDFESELRSAASRNISDSPEDIKARLATVSQSINGGGLLKTANTLGVQLDLEMAALNQTVLKYSALVQGLKQYGSLTAMAISGDGSK